MWWAGEVDGQKQALSEWEEAKQIASQEGIEPADSHHATRSTVLKRAPLTVRGTPPTPRAPLDRPTRAIDFDDYVNVTLADATRTEGDVVAPALPAHPATVLFRSAELSGAVRFEAEVVRSIRLGSGATGGAAGDRLLAQIAVPVIGDRHTWST